VLAALNQIGADVGEPIDISQDPQHRDIIVRAYGLSPERRQEIAQALKPLLRVVLDFNAARSGLLPSQPATPETSSTSIPARLREQFENKLGGAAALQEVTDRVLEASASALARAYAVEVLARNFPPETEALLVGPDREVLRALRDNHISELGRLVAGIRGDLKPLVTASPNVRLPQATDIRSTRGWQAGVPSLVALAQETDKSLNHLLAGSYSQISGEEMLRALPLQIEQLESAIRSERQAGK
jgi:hypothetical protein